MENYFLQNYNLLVFSAMLVFVLMITLSLEAIKFLLNYLKKFFHNEKLYPQERHPFKK